MAEPPEIRFLLSAIGITLGVHMRHPLSALAAAAAALLIAIPGFSGDTPATIDLMPAPDLKGWTRIPIPPGDGLRPAMQWRVDSVRHELTCTGEGGHEWLRFDREFGDFILEVEWRFTPRDPEEKRYNSGIGVRLSRFGEIWTQAQTGLAGGYLFGSDFTDGALKPFHLAKQMTGNRVKPAGEWNHYQITAQGDRISLAVNGATVSERSGAGLRRGFIGLEAEGYEITFRKLLLKLLN